MADQHTDNLGNVPNPSETFGNVPNDSESFGSFPHVSARQENHILTVRQVARMFEEAGVARTERSITNWCKRDASGVSRLDAYLDINEHKYFITPESVERAIVEEQAKANLDGLPNISEHAPQSTTLLPKPSEEVRHTSDRGGDTGEQHDYVKQLEKEIFDLKILNSGKDFYIQKLQEDRQFFLNEHKDMTNRMIETSQRLGQLESKVFEIEVPKHRSSKTSDSNPPRIREAEVVTDHSFSAEPHPTSEASSH